MSTSARATRRMRAGGGGGAVGAGSAPRPSRLPTAARPPARATGPDADAAHVSRSGVPPALVSIPLRYMHSPVELVQLDDVRACARLIAAAALRLDEQTSFGR